MLWVASASGWAKKFNMLLLDNCKKYIAQILVCDYLGILSSQGSIHIPYQHTLEGFISGVMKPNFWLVSKN